MAARKLSQSKSFILPDKPCTIILMTNIQNPKPLWTAKKIKNLRVQLKLTQQELADEIGTRQQTISEWETGMYEPRGATARLLTIVAERANFKYEATPKQESKDKQ
jgi:DNA-binding transcriptional regulator YiaG